MFCKKISVRVTCAVMLLACHQANSMAAVGKADIRTEEFFMKNPDVTKSVVQKCLTFERQGFSKLSSSDQKNWQDSIDGINCRNAKQAAAWMYLNERQQQLEDSIKRFGGDSKK